MTNIEEAKGHVASLRSERAAARQRAHGELLSAPGCSEGCTICPRSCAVAGILLGWWEGELARLVPSNVIAFPTDRTRRRAA